MFFHLFKNGTGVRWICFRRIWDARRSALIRHGDMWHAHCHIRDTHACGRTCFSCTVFSSGRLRERFLGTAYFQVLVVNTGFSFGMGVVSLRNRGRGGRRTLKRKNTQAFLRAITTYDVEKEPVQTQEKANQPSRK